jgi:hypothetical protein
MIHMNRGYSVRNLDPETQATRNVCNHGQAHLLSQEKGRLSLLEIPTSRTVRPRPAEPSTVVSPYPTGTSGNLGVGMKPRRRDGDRGSHMLFLPPQVGYSRRAMGGVVRDRMTSC